MNINENLFVSGKIESYIVGKSNDGCIAGWRRATNDGTGTGGFQGGYRNDYLTKDSTPPGFDVGHVTISYCQNPGAKGQFEGEWHVSCSPQDDLNPWSCFAIELNIGSFVDAGYSETINCNHATGGILVGATVPGAFGSDWSSKNATFAFATAGIPNHPKYAQLYNGLLINPDSIAKSGKGIQANGANLVDNAPAAVIDVTRNWETGIKLERGNYKDNKAITLQAGQKITWSDGTEAVHLTPQQIRRLLRLLA